MHVQTNPTNRLGDEVPLRHVADVGFDNGAERVEGSASEAPNVRGCEHMLCGPPQAKTACATMGTDGQASASTTARVHHNTRLAGVRSGGVGFGERIYTLCGGAPPDVCGFSAGVPDR